ncbi:growth arrest-specific protein 2 [Anabrus simplex]|uniref:growth arrest-specific protein 2 n=1 Tax=Anabrus simplex TaxID=316456 RepID=UPI0035A2CA77
MTTTFLLSRGLSMTPARMLSGRYRRSGGGGPTSLPAEQAVPVPETEQEYVEYFQDRITSAQHRQLFPLQEDLADWLNKTLDTDHVTGDNFLDAIDNGVMLCHLAQVIQVRAQELAESGVLSGPLPKIQGRCWERAARRSFFSRDNMENFITFCRRLGVHSNLLFESDDLVLQNNPRSVILCLLEVARIAQRFGVEPPGLVQLEKEIEEEEGKEQLLSWQFQRAVVTASPRGSPEKIRHSSSSSAISSGSVTRWGRPIGRPRSGERRSLMLLETSPSSGGGGQLSPARDLRRTSSEGNTGPVGAASGGASDGVPSDTTEDDWSRGSGEDPDMELDHDMGGGQGDIEMTELDRKVQQATKVAQRQCHCPPAKCSRLKVKKVGEGRYNIAGRNVFIRLLKGRHMMVRVGGGWDTLEHFLLRHDPCQIKVVSRDSPTNRSFLHIQAKYRSPPPSEPIGR